MRNTQNTPFKTARVSLLRPPASIGPSLRTKQRFENRPLGVGNVHALDLRHWP